MQLHEAEELCEIRKLSTEKVVRDLLKRFVMGGMASKDGDIAWSAGVISDVKGWLK